MSALLPTSLLPESISANHLCLSHPVPSAPAKSSNAVRLLLVLNRVTGFAPHLIGVLTPRKPSHGRSTPTLLPDNLSYAQATNFNSYATSCAALTWPHLLNLQAGQTLLVHGAAGAIGLAAIDIAKIIGATVIATASTEEKRAAALNQGADHVIDYSDGQFRDAVNDITGGKGANAILDPVGGDVFDQSLRCIAMEGRICPVGFTSGRAAQAPSNIVLVKNIAVCGLNMGTYYGWSPVDLRYEMEDRVRSLMTAFDEWSAGRKDYASGLRNLPAR